MLGMLRKIGVMAKVGWISTIGEDAVKAYCRVPPHEDTLPQSAEFSGGSVPKAPGGNPTYMGYWKPRGYEVFPPPDKYYRHPLNFS